MNFKITLRGFDKLPARIQAPFSPSVLSDIARKSGTIVQMGAKMYPPKLANQKYIRTYRLRSNWIRKRLEISGNTVRQTVSNKTPYARWVQLEGSQNKFHKDRWYTTLQILEGNKKPIVDYALGRLNDALKRGK